ncbi:MAG TPA: hypothetical protein PKW24_04065 [Clostridiales bacterium]|jgi:hypothetical protein|nr:hypothetical protein [Clostridiales bacterium]
MKKDLNYFLKTQLSVILLFNFLLFMSYFPFVIFSLVYFYMYDKPAEPLAYSYFVSAVPLLVFFFSGLYYRNARHYYLSYVTPRFFLYSSGKTYKSKTPIERPQNIFMRHFPAFFPLLYSLAALYLYPRARFSPFYMLVNLPYNWIRVTPIWFFVFGNSKLNTFMFPMVLSCLTYAAFALGYLIGGLPAVAEFFNRSRMARPKKREQSPG